MHVIDLTEIFTLLIDFLGSRPIPEGLLWQLDDMKDVAYENWVSR